MRLLGPGGSLRRGDGREAAGPCTEPVAGEGSMSKRVDWHTYFMNIARQASTRSTCERKHVGAVIVRDRTILSTGYNGSIRGMPHCDDVGHVMEGGHCIATIHAEANAIIQAAKNGVRTDGAIMYSTVRPCWGCYKVLVNAGIRKVFYREEYPDKYVDDGRALVIEFIKI